MYEIPIERGKIREFAIATKATNPAYQGPDAVIPPTFLTTAAMSWEPPGEFPTEELSFDMRRILHGEEEYLFFGPLPRAGETLAVSARLGDRWEKEGKRGGTMRFATLVREFRNAAGDLVAEQRSTLVETSRPPSES
ncbi:MAG TPA: MaoC family dehydratase N-terminal domain-containing protein [Acidimicrobiales bacterium]|nr:MaoC family dehydratase N-terminal domain-containing protein [Acidimicrobiales bacterium]